MRRFASEPGEQFALPDEPPADPTQIRWSAGSWDGVATHHVGQPHGAIGLLARAKRRLFRQADPSTRLSSALVDLARDGGDRERLVVYRAAQDPDLLAHIDPALERVLREPTLLRALAPDARRQSWPARAVLAVTVLRRDGAVAGEPACVSG